MKSLKVMLALTMVAVMLIGATSVVLAEDEVTVDVPEIAVEQPEAEKPKAEEPKAEVRAEIIDEQPVEHKNNEAGEAPAQEAPEAIETGFDPEAIEIESDNGLIAEIELSGETTEPDQPAETEDGGQSGEAGELTGEQSGELAGETEELVNIEDEMTPLALRPATPFDGAVLIFASSNKPVFGERVKFTSELKGFTGDYNLLFQWQINKGDGWRNIADANGRDFEFTYTERVQDCRWRLSVTIDG